VLRTVTDADQADIVRRLTRDVDLTVGLGHENEILRQASLRRAYYFDDLEGYREKVVEEVQQYFHDLFIHTTWPSCPRHRRHPLWLHGEFWTCEQDGVPIGRLGELDCAE
jgi:hypothetical protein